MMFIGNESVMMDDEVLELMRQAYCKGIFRVIGHKNPDFDWMGEGWEIALDILREYKNEKHHEDGY